MLTEDEKRKMEAQVALSKCLGLGFALSVVPTGGVGSLAALWIGLRAYKKIANSEQGLHGIGMALWCIIVGSLGAIACAIFWVYSLVIEN